MINWYVIDMRIYTICARVGGENKWVQCGCFNQFNCWKIALLEKAYIGVMVTDGSFVKLWNSV